MKSCFFIICQLQLVEENIQLWETIPLFQANPIFQHKHVHVVPQVYRIQSSNTGSQWTSGSRIETLWNMHEEIYTCFQVTKAGILKRDAEFSVCLSAYVHLHGRMHEQHSFLALPAQTLRGRKRRSTPPPPLARRDRHQVDREKCCETVQPSALKKVPSAAELNWELNAWKQVKVGPTETSLKLELETWWRVDQRGTKRSSQVAAWLLSIHLCKYESIVEGV